MDEPSPGDPYTWDVTLLTRELCGSPRPWAPLNPQKRPDAAALSAALQEHELDGETLLTWDDIFGSHNDLFRDLGIVKATHRMTIAKAILHLKKRSPLYRQAKQRILSEQASEDAEDIELPDAEPLEETAASPIQKSLLNPSSHALTAEPAKVAPAPPFAALPAQKTPTPSAAELKEATSEPPSKKRRLAPQLITSEVRDVGRAPIPTAADSVTITAAYGPAIFQNDSKAVYLGKGALVLAEWVPESSLRSSYQQDSGTEPEEFSWHRSARPIAPGRQLQMKRGVMRLLQANSKAEKLLQENIAPFVELSPSPEPSSEDKVLPCFGDSDDDGYDSETIMEMEAEAAEKQRPTDTLAKDEVQAVLDDVIHSYIRRWNEEKLPRHQRNAYSTWRMAQRKGRNQEIARSIRRAAELEARIRSLVAEIHSQDWPTEKPLRRQARCLEASIEDRQKELWLGEMLKGREPPRTTVAPRPRQRRSRRPADVSDEDGEFITSDSDMSGDDVPTTVRRLRTSATPPMAARGGSAAPGEVVDLTGPGDRDGDSDSSDSSKSSRSVVDLTTPVDAHFTGIPPPEEQFVMTRQQLEIPFNRPREIGQINVSAWVQCKDPLRLTISFLWKKSPAWRHKVFQLVRRKSPDAIWRDLVLPTCQSLGRPTPGNSSQDFALKFVQLFWQYVSCSLSSVIFSTALSKLMMEEVPQRRAEFEQFISFLKEHVIPHMPTVEPAAAEASAMVIPMDPVEDIKPTIEAETDEDDTESDDLDEHHGAPTPSSKKKTRVRSVKRNEAAEQMRTQESARFKEQQRRKMQIMQRVATSGTISKEEARLIINVSKEGDDDSGFVSVSSGPVPNNSTIAARIKDHQIEGVRFMWDHLMADQGCLLAHTMGLGKTMQVITVLVAIAEAGSSENPAVKSQVPPALHWTDEKQPKILILCPAGLVDNWMEEFYAWAPVDTYVVKDNVRCVDSSTLPMQREVEIKEWVDRGGVLIIGYDLFRNLCSENEQVSRWLRAPDIVVADEAHRLKNRSSKLSAITSSFDTNRRVALTGTPLANNVGEFFSAINWIAPNFLGPFKEFTAIYVDPIERGLWEDSSASEFRKAKKMLAALEKTVASKTHRLTMACLKEQLPAKVEFVITAPMTPFQAKIYRLYISSLQGLEQGMNPAAQVFAVTTNLMLLCNHPKCFQQRLLKERRKRDDLAANKAVNEEPDKTLSSTFISESLQIFARERDVGSMHHSWKVMHLIKILDECRKTKEKVLVFSQSIPTLDYLGNLLRQQGRSMQKMTGSTESKARQTMVRDFNTKDTQEVFLISTGAGGIGLNITGASRVVIFDFKFNPVSELQAIGRAYRIGQRRNVYVYRFIAAGTYEKHLHNKAVFKEQLASRVVDKENPKRYSTKIGDLVRPLDENVRFEDLSPYVGRDNILDIILAQQKRQKSINSIILTDTFTEEDPNDTELSAEEYKEVDSMIEMNRLRHTDPARFAALEQELAMKQASQQHKMMYDAAAKHAPPSSSAGPATLNKVPMSAAPPFRPYVASKQTAQHGQQPVSEDQPQIPPLMPPQAASRNALHSMARQMPPNAPNTAPVRLAWVAPRVPAPPGVARVAVHNAGPSAGPQVLPRAPPTATAQQAASPRSALHALQPAPPTTPRSASDGVSGQPDQVVPRAHPQAAQAPSFPNPAAVVPSSMPQMPMVPAGNTAYNHEARGGGGLESFRQGPQTSEDRLSLQVQLFAKKVFQGAFVNATNKGQMPPPPVLAFRQAEDIANSARKLQVDRNAGFLPDKARWNELTDKADIPLFCGDVLDGKVSVEMMVTGDLSAYNGGPPAKKGNDNSQLSNGPLTMASLPTATEASLPQGAAQSSTPQGKQDTPAAGSKAKDPNHLRNALSRTNTSAGASNGSPSNSRAHEDMMALRQVANRRKSRPQSKLPPWANRAVEDGQ